MKDTDDIFTIQIYSGTGNIQKKNVHNKIIHDIVFLTKPNFTELISSPYTSLYLEKV